MVPAVRRVRGGVNHQVSVTQMALKQPANAIVVVDVEGHGPEASETALRLGAHVRRRSHGPEEVGPHVVLDRDHSEALLGEEAHGLRSDQSA